MVGLLNNYNIFLILNYVIFKVLKINYFKVRFFYNWNKYVSLFVSSNEKYMVSIIILNGYMFWILWVEVIFI